mmetsp:Transcript_13761/g.28834  ORF Transcript_13761/g.28834 Transcript_13761/m.28834 type:complete len:267 (+) Transcript_13761:86-886(+)
MNTMVRNTPNHTAMRLLLSFLVLLCHTKESQGFAVPPVVRQYPLYYHAHHVNFDAAAGITTKLYADRSAGDSSGRPPLLSPPTRPLFPVLKRIAGVNWAGSCRFINGDLMPTSLRLRGGIRFDLPDYDEDDVDEDDDNTVKMNSFIVFPNGKSRQIEMSGKRGSLERPSMKLDSIEGDGPIYTVITELKPDTILINELDKATGRVVMTSSLSLVVDQSAAKSVTELIQVSHEVGSSTTNNKSAIIEGHQVWRFRKTDTLPKEVTWQ